ncbi:MAG TPA: LamG domain-containing protein, partial [Kofleriaceae bacterium]
MDGRTFKAFGMCVGLVLAACGSQRDTSGDAEDDPAELQALLRDDPLGGVASPPPTAPSAIAPPNTLLPQRFWSFDDCSPDRAELFSANPAETAYRSVGVSCAPGVRGSAVALAAQEDLVYVPDEPYFTFGDGITVAAWFKPTGLDRTQTLFRKRDKGTSAFALVLHRGRFRFVIDLGDGHAASVTAPGPARVGEFQHVAASYDGAALRLYLDGHEVAARAVAGTIPPGPGPLVIGNDGSERRFDGVIDEAAFDLRALAPEQVLQLVCFPVEPTVAVTPGTSAPTTPDVPVTFDIAVTNNNPAACLAMDFELRVGDVPAELNFDPSQAFQVNSQVPSGATTHFTLTATPYDVVSFENPQLSFSVSASDWNFFSSGFLEVIVDQPAGCHVSKSHELLINDSSVLSDFFRTQTQGPAGDRRVGAWTFKHLMEEMAPTPADAPAMVEDMLRGFLTPQIINGFTVAPRPGMAPFLNGWPRTADGKLDLAQAPFRLKAMVNRIDLRDLDRGDAGEASFIFGFADNGFDDQATMIFEYRIPAATEADVLGWAQAFHALGALPFSEQYNAALQAITDRIVQRGARPGGVNGSALHAVRTNEFPFGGESSFNSELREFTLSATTGRLAPSPLEQTPDQSFNGTAALGDFITANRDAILAGTHTVPDQLGGHPFRAGAMFDLNVPTWHAPGVDPEARHAFALATCNGCHLTETGTFMEHVVPFGQGVAALSSFLRGGPVTDPVTGDPRTFNDMLRRRQDLEAIVCPPAPTVS